MIEALANALNWHSAQKVPFTTMLRTKSGLEFEAKAFHPFNLEDKVLVISVDVNDEGKVANMFMSVDSIESFTIIV